MSQRERWIVYPLLFFSFALAIRDQYPPGAKEASFSVLNCDLLSCRHLVVKDANGLAAVDIHATPGGSGAGSGNITLYGSTPKAGVIKPPAVRIYVKHQNSAAGERFDFGAVETVGPLGSPATRLISDGYGGAVVTYDLQGKYKGAFSIRPTPGETRPPHGAAEDPRQAVPRPPVPPDAEPSNGDEQA